MTEHMDAGDVLALAEGLLNDADSLIRARAHADEQARRDYAAAIESDVHLQLAALPVDALQDATEGRVRVGLVHDAGLRSVADVRHAGRARIEAIRGVGPKTSAQLIAAAEQLTQAIRAAARVRFDVETRPPLQKALLQSVHRLNVIRTAIDPIEPQLWALRNAIAQDIGPARLQTKRVRRLFTGRHRRQQSEQAFTRIAEALASATTGAFDERLQHATAAVAELDRPVDGWQLYQSKPVEFNGLVAELSGVDDSEAARGFLPAELVERITAIELDQSLLNVSLRGYQAFGAQFALAQVRTILGDEMGLGKTIQALAVLCHLRAQGYTHFLVVCPASVLANWEHETARHTQLDLIWRLHGPERAQRSAGWADKGGVAITTFGTMRLLDIPSIDVAAIIVDEAHYVKNPDAKRTQAVKNWLVQPSYTMLMSGTPMENRVAEFRSLVAMVRPDIADTIDDAAGLSGADAFRRQVAPVYLRRNQDDVLDELPEKIETAEWLTLDGNSLDAYRAAVASGNFMAMRRAAFMTPNAGDSPKLFRLLEIVAEAVRNNRKVIVFSYFRDVLDRVSQALGGQAIGQITGSVPAGERQAIVDRFTASTEPCVLVSQIEAGGIGLNIQTASVVIITEPQWKPSTEEQAIARCHRMGQIRPVEVHRLLTEDSVDERMVEVLAQKSALFANYVRESDLRDAAPGAIDVTSAEAVQAITGASDTVTEQLIITAERERLGL